MKDTKPARDRQGYVVVAGCLLFLCICAALGGIWISAILSVVFAAVLYGHFSANRRYDAAAGAISSRHDIPVESQWEDWDRDGLVGTESACRIWRAWASFYEVPPDKLRCADRFGAELAGLASHPNSGVADALLSEGVDVFRYRETLEECRTWSDVVVATYRIEIEEGHKIDPSCRYTLSKRRTESEKAPG